MGGRCPVLCGYLERVTGIMLLDESIYKGFLEEMKLLENFRMTYAAAHPGVPLDRDDPDVRRLIEALAFFAVRSRLAAVSNVVASQLRIFQQFYSYLLAPLPAMSILQARPTGQFVETVLFPKGSEIAISPAAGGNAFFRTTHDLRILPISLTGLRTLLLPNRGFRLVLQFNAPYSRNDEIGRLSLHVDHLNDFLASLRVFHALKEHFVRGSVVFDAKVDETTQGIPCDVTFGALAEDDDGPEDESPHPLQKERFFFHLPAQELYLNIQIPAPPRNWSGFTLCLDLNSNWPRSLVLNRDVFHLFSVPIVNLRRSMAQPVICDGTQQRYAIRHSEPELGFELHSILGVYEVRKTGMVPMRAGIISGGSGSYEIEQAPDRKGGTRQWLVLHFPEAFEKPRTIAMDALWLQPWFSEAIPQNRTIAPYSRNIVGVAWELPGDLVPHKENDFLEGMESYTHLLTLTNKAVLNSEDVACLLRTLGSIHRGEFQKILQALMGVRVEEVPQQHRNGKGMLKYVYFLRFREQDSVVRPLMETLAAHVGNILDTWISEGVIEVRLEIADEKEWLATGRAGV